MICLKFELERAVEEVTMKESLNEVIGWFQSTSLLCCEHTYNQRCTPIIKDYLVQLSTISNQLEILVSLKDSIYFSSIAELSSIYENKLILLNEVMVKLFEVQKSWLHLERIFRSDAISIDKEGFDGIDSSFRSIMNRNSKCMVKHLLDESRNPNLARLLEGMLNEMEHCQRELLTYIEEKRAIFPRLNFVGQNTIIELLGSSKRPHSIQMHLKHLYQAINTIVFDDSMTRIIAFKSAHLEQVNLAKVRSFSIFFS